MNRTPRVSALYRYPVKGFTRESRDTLDVLPGGRIAGDRVLALRFNDSATPDDAWSTKLECVALVHTPGLARLRLRFDHAELRLRIGRDDAAMFDGVLDAPGRARFANVIGEYVRNLDENPIGGRTDRLPLRVVGDGTVPRYQDREPGYVTLHGRASLGDVARHVGEAPELTEQRFRSNIAIDGVDAWAEQRFVGRRLRIGDVEFDVANPVTRCLATHANPLTGKRDIPMMKKLLELLPTERPTFAVMMTSERGGSIRVGDEVALIE
jgi:uncharacterized protein YcbX